MKEKQNTIKKVGKGKKAALVLMVLVTVLIVAGVITYCLLPSKKGSNQPGSNTAGGFAEQMGQKDVVSAYGVTGIGSIQVEFPITNLESSLIVEEVYISSGDTIVENMPILKLTEESIETVRAELEADLKDADLAYRAGLIEYEQSKITAYYDKEQTLLDGKHAETVYKESITGLSSNVESAKASLDEANAKIAEYEAAIKRNSYYEDYKVEFYKNIYDENLALLKEKMEEWQVSWSEVTSGRTSSSGAGNMGSGGMGSGGMGSGGIGSGDFSGNIGDFGGGVMPMVQTNVSGGSDLHSQYVYVLSSLYNVLEQNLSDYEQAYADYESAVADTSYNLQSLKLQLSSLKQNYAQALESYESSISQAELTKQKSLSNAEKAETNYEANMEKAEADYEKLKTAKEEAEENLVIFETMIRDGYLYASQAGSVQRMSLRAGGRISSEGQLYVLRDTTEMTVTVSVDQSDIASLTVGDQAVVQSESNGIYNGEIIAINPISGSESKTNITYSVTVKMTGRFSGLSGNETVVVYFGMKGFSN